MAKRKVELVTPDEFKELLGGYGWFFVHNVDAHERGRGIKTHGARLEKHEARIVAIYAAALERIAELEKTLDDIAAWQGFVNPTQGE